MTVTVRFEIDAMIPILREKIGSIGSSESESFAGSDVGDSIIPILKSMRSTLPILVSANRGGGEGSRNYDERIRLGSIVEDCGGGEAEERNSERGEEHGEAKRRWEQTGWKNRNGGRKQEKHEFSATS